MVRCPTESRVAYTLSPHCIELSSALAVQGCAAAIKTDDAKHIANVCGKTDLNMVKLIDNLMLYFRV